MASDSVILCIVDRQRGENGDASYLEIFQKLRDDNEPEKNATQYESLTTFVLNSGETPAKSQDNFDKQLLWNQIPTAIKVAVFGLAGHVVVIQNTSEYSNAFHLLPWLEIELQPPTSGHVGRVETNDVIRILKAIADDLLPSKPYSRDTQWPKKRAKKWREYGSQPNLAWWDTLTMRGRFTQAFAIADDKKDLMENICKEDDESLLYSFAPGHHDGNCHNCATWASEMVDKLLGISWLEHCPTWLGLSTTCTDRLLQEKTRLAFKNRNEIGGRNVTYGRMKMIGKFAARLDGDAGQVSYHKES